MSTRQKISAQALVSNAPIPEFKAILAADGKMLFDYAGLPGLRTISPPEIDDLCILIRTEQSERLDSCPQCGCPYGKEFKRNGTHLQYMSDEPRGLRSVRIEVKRQSYYCKICFSAPQQLLTGKAEKRNMTTRLLEYVQVSSMLDSFSVVSQRTNLSTKTVREVFIDYTRVLDQNTRFKTPKVLGLDGVYIDGKECAILTDIEAGLVIDVWQDYKTEQVIDALERLPDLENIKVVVIDMSSKLRKAVRKAFPKAVIVIDRFHIQRYANIGIDNVRMRLHMGKRIHTRMCTRDLLRKHWNKLKDEEKVFLERCFNLEPELRRAYEAKEALFEIWHSSSSETAKARYQKWLGQLPLSLRGDFKKLLTAMKNWGEYIFNYFDNRYTNAFTEQSNRQVKDLVREARGCHFKTARAKIIYGTILRQQQKAAREQAAEKKRMGKANRKLTGRLRKKASQCLPIAEPMLAAELGRDQVFIQTSFFE